MDTRKESFPLKLGVLVVSTDGELAEHRYYDDEEKSKLSHAVRNLIQKKSNIFFFLHISTHFLDTKQKFYDLRFLLCEEILSSIIF